MDREMRLQRLIDIKSQADRTSNWFLTIAMFIMIMAIFPAWSGYYALSLGLVTCGAVMTAFGFFVAIKLTKVQEQINREYGKPEESIDFK